MSDQVQTSVFPIVINGHRLFRIYSRIRVEPVYGDSEEVAYFDSWQQALDHIDRRNGNIPGGEQS